MSDDKEYNEVSGYGGGENFIGDTNDHWRVEINGAADKKIPKEQRFLKAILTRFRLVHVNTGKALFSHPVKLPKYGF